VNKRTQRIPIKCRLCLNNLLVKPKWCNLVKTYIMKQLSLFVCIFLMIGLLSCDHKKEEEFTLSEGLPSWVKQKVEELTANGESCKFVDIKVIEYKENLYYDIAYGYSSCALCNVFDKNGNRFIPTENNFSGHKIINILPACP